MDLIFQDTQGSIPQIHGGIVERLLCVESLKENGGKTPCLFLLKLSEGNTWYRFYLDTGYCTWERYEALPAEDLGDPEDYPWYELGDRESLRGLRIVDTLVEEIGQELKLTLSFSHSKKLIVSAIGMEGESVLDIRS